MNSEQSLQTKVNELKAVLPEREWKYYHLGSIDNFIFHLKNLENDRTRAEVAAQLEVFLDLAKSIVSSEDKLLTKAMDLGPLLWKIALPYKTDLGFIKKPDILVSSILAIILFFILCFFSSFENSIVVCSLFYSLYLMFGWYKTHKRLVY